MKPGSASPYEQPKKLSKGYKFSQTTKAPKIKGMDGFAKFGRVGGKVTPGKD
jgi:hypothetical protein